MKEMKHKTGPKLGTGGKRNKLRICLTADVEAFWKRNGDTLGGSDRDEHAKISSVQAVVDTRRLDTTLQP